LDATPERISASRNPIRLLKSDLPLMIDALEDHDERHGCQIDAEAAL